jgi:nicotinamide-nucleotide amidase
MKAGVICIGNEILLGKTINTNLTFIGKKLAEIGIFVEQSVVIRDEENAILQALEQYWTTYDLVIVSGGLGPTIDDITKQTIATYFRKPLAFSSIVWEQVQERFRVRNLHTPPINKNQAFVPEDFTPLKNNFGTAPGLCLRENNKLFFAVPGVPVEMKHLMTEKIIPIVQKIAKKNPIHITNIHTWNITESLLAEKLSSIQIPERVSLAFLPQTGRVDLRVYGENETENKDVIQQIYEQISAHIWGENQKSPAQKIHELFINSNKKLTFAESCTGGLVQEMITEFSGSSSYFLGGIVSYANEIKERILQVPKDILDTVGAVSEETARAMVKGVSNVMNAEYAGAITGIAGPSGGTIEKPVGTVYIAVKTPQKTVVKKLLLQGNRETIRLKSAENLLLLLWENLDESF